MDERPNSQDLPPPRYSRAIAVDEVFSSAALCAVTSDGRLDISADSSLLKVISRIDQQNISTNHPTNISPPVYSKEDFNLKLNICIQVVGSRGDVQPFIALGTELLRRGHRVRLATHNVFEGSIREAGLEFFGVGGDPAELMSYMIKNPALIPSVKSLRDGDVQAKRSMVANMLSGFWQSCIAPDAISGKPFITDAIIANPPSFAHVHCAQALSIPLHMMFTMPWSSTKEFPHPLVNFNEKTVELPNERLHYASYRLVDWITWQGLGDLINSWRKEIGLQAIPRSEGYKLAETLQIPFTYCWSKALVPKPEDWPDHIDVCGFLFKDLPEYTPPQALQRFLDAGDLPIYIGFGSIVVEEPARLITLLLEAIKIAGVRAIISNGWSRIDTGAIQNPNVLFIDECPHEWLFSKVRAVVHHGGAGTTACGLLNECPTVTIPFFGDQYFWGSMVVKVGAGPEPIPYKQLTSYDLANAIQYCLHPSIKNAASEIASLMRQEYGVQDAADSFFRHLPTDKIKCQILADRPATWTYNSKKISMNISRPAAELLLQRNLTTSRHLTRFRAKPILIGNERWDPLTAFSSSLLGTTTEIATSSVNIVAKPIQAYSEASKNKRDERAEARAVNDMLSTSDSKSALASGSTPSLISSSASAQASSPLPSPSLAQAQTQPSSSRSKSKTFIKACTGSATSILGVIGYMSKGVLIDMPLATAEGFRAIPKLYGSDMPDYGNVTDWKSGGVVAAKNFGIGMATGFADMVTEPVKGFKNGGVVGATLGIGKGLGNMACGVASGTMGLVGYTGQGLVMSAIDAVRGRVKRAVDLAAHEQGKDELARLSNAEVEEIVRAFGSKTEPMNN